jgi:hypothetical protein
MKIGTIEDVDDEDDDNMRSSFGSNSDNASMGNGYLKDTIREFGQ